MSVIAKRVTSRDEDEKRDSEPLMRDDGLRGENEDERKVKRAKPQRTSFKVVGHLVMAMKRFQDSLNPTYTYGKRTPTSSINQDGDTADDSVVSQPSPSLDDKKKGDSSYYSSRGHKTDLIFKSLPSLDGESPPTADFALSRPFKRGALDLQHRVVLAPLTRCRSPNNVPPALATTYYSQRASPGGLLISEGVAVSEAARGYVDVPGLWRADQVAAWRRVTEAVHARGALIFAQLWHVGRASLRAYQPGGRAPVSASAVAVGEPFLGLDPATFQQVPLDTPQALTLEGIRETIADFVAAAENALAAGFDGVEVHGANGYLLEQFLSDAANRREDAYGGSAPNRARFVLELVDAVARAVGAERVALRLSPYNRFLNSPTSDAEEVYVHLVRELTARHALAYVHLVEGRVMGSGEAPEPTPALDSVARASAAPVMLAGGYTRESGAAAVAEGRGDLIAFGRLFLANPDLPLRFAKNVPLNPPNRATFYAPPGGSDPAVGYTDYPFAESSAPQA